MDEPQPGPARMDFFGCRYEGLGNESPGTRMPPAPSHTNQVPHLAKPRWIIPH